MPLHEHRISSLLRHETAPPSQATRPDAKSTARSTLPVTRDDLKRCERSRGHARRLEAHRMRKARPRHGRALPTACTCAWNVTRMVGCVGGACTWSQHWTQSPREGRERRRASSCTRGTDRPRWSKHGLSERDLGAGRRPAKRQVEPSTCRGATAVDGSDIGARPRRPSAAVTFCA